VKEINFESRFEKEFLTLLTSKQRQNELSRNIKKMALPNATKQIVDEIDKILNL